MSLQDRKLITETMIKDRELNSVLVGEKDMSVGFDQAEGSTHRSSGHGTSGQGALENASHGFGERLLKSLKPLALMGMLAVPLVAPVSAQAAGLVKTTTITYTYDDYGNATQVDTSVTDGVETFTTSVSATITNEESKWLLGRTTQVVTTSTNADQTSLSRTSAVTYHGDTFLPATTTVEPGDPTLEVVTTYGYDSFGNVTSASVAGVGETARTANTTYSPDGRFALSSSNALGHSSSVVTDSRFGMPISSTDANGIITTFEYDGFGRSKRQFNADGTEIVTSFGLCSDAVITCPSGAVERVLQQSLETASGIAIAANSITYLDKLGREIRSESQMADGSVIYGDTVYDSFGRVIKTSAPYKAGNSSIDWALNDYDVLDRVIKSTDLNGAMTTTAYSGLSVTITTPLQETESRKSNARGELVLVTDTMGGTIAYSYDAFGNLTSTTDAKNNTVTIAYDKLGRKLNMDDPDMGYWSYGYNSYGELTSQTDAKGQTNTLNYDILGRLIQRVEAEGTTTWTYDTAANGLGLLHSATGPGGSGQPDYIETHAYDSLSRPSSTTRKIRGKDYASTVSYDTAGRLGNVTYPTGFAVDYSYTATGYLDQITKTADSSLIWKAKTRDADGRVREAQLGNGLTEWTDVDELGRVTSRRLSGAQGLQLDLAMTFDLVGNLTARQDNVQDRKETFGYDALNRLTSNLLVKTSDSTQLASNTYGYDIIGNMTLKSDLSHGGIMTYDPARPHAVATAKGGSYTYDLNGNLTGGGGRSVSWTSFNKPATIDATVSLSATSFVYGPDRARIRQTIVEAGTTTEVAYVGSYYEERTPVTSAGVQSGTMEQIHYIRADEASLAIHKIEVAVDQTTTTKTRWMSLDHIGSTTVTTDELGLVEERLSYDPHGKRREGDWQEASLPVRPTFTPRGFTGHEHLDAVGIIHMNGRVYDPELGRFLSADPTIPEAIYTQDFNRYSYVRNNPLSYTDPTGFRHAIGSDRQDDERERDRERDRRDSTFDKFNRWAKNFFGNTTQTQTLEEAIAEEIGRGRAYLATINRKFGIAVLSNTPMSAPALVEWAAYVDIYNEIQDFVDVVSPGDLPELETALQADYGDIIETVALGLATRRVGAAPSLIQTVKAPKTFRTQLKQYLSNIKSVPREKLLKDLKAIGFKEVKKMPNGMIHLQRGQIKLRLDPPHLTGPTKTQVPYDHMHINMTGGLKKKISTNKRAFNKDLKPTDYRSSDAHIEIQGP
ncbi:RHS repeat domain-containing protein [Kiloniella spongiae]|uniref:RHS repeat domain-containing protein n=1 Tax=Kiloniella spongiae TaxID=1489064 RepID=UPI00069AE315|nr:RHS repeat-associated core domain-containing protein [Kiloniella spongiae]